MSHLSDGSNMLVKSTLGYVLNTFKTTDYILNKGNWIFPDFFPNGPAQNDN